MHYLIDTHIFLWWHMANRRLPDAIKQFLKTSPGQVMLSVVVPWEITIKTAKGKMPGGEKLLAVMGDSEFDPLPILPRHVAALAQLPALHGDPFDRMLAAQCLADDMTLITADPVFSEYPIKRWR